MTNFIDSINRKYGDRSIFLLDSADIEAIPVIPTGSLKLDIALGVGGFPRGRIVEVYGPESSGKTTLCQHLISNCQQLGGKAAFVDVEHAVDPHWLNVCGIKVEELYVSQPDNGEMAMNVVEMIVRSKEVDLVILDSVAGLVPRAEIEGEMGDAHMALIARLMSQGMRKLSAPIKESDCCVVFTNQLRKNIGSGPWGPSDVTTGGEALKYWASVRIDLRRSSQIKDKDETIGNKVRVTIRKNKVAPPFKVTELDIYYEEGISHLSEIIHYGKELGFIDKSGAWFTITHEGEQIAKVQGEQNLRNELRSNDELLLLIENNVRQNFGLPLRGEKNV